LTRTLRLEGYRRSRHQLTVGFAFDDLFFSNSFWYADVDLRRLEERFGRDFLERIYFHVAAFEANKLCSLRPARLDLGPFARFHTPAFEEVWRTVLRRVWAQWRYQHDDPDYAGPEIDSVAAGGGRPVAIAPGSTGALCFCGGGKDSLAAMKLLEDAAIAYDAFSYSSSVYGSAELQHRLADRVLDHRRPGCRRRLWIFDDFMDSPVAGLHPELGTRHLLAGETPSSVFAALPLVLAHGYRHLIVAHERSADFGNLVWRRTGEEINHQWGKSLAAERLLTGYVEGELVSSVRYFSLLKPIWDVLIFNLLAGDLAAVRDAHSCNVEKPWCRRCPKCAYVWLGYAAFLPGDAAVSIFGRNLFDAAENLPHYRGMLGLEEHTPFECIGTVGEARLAFEICRRKGFGGRAMELFADEVPAVDVAASLDRYLAIDEGNSAIPAAIARRLRGIFEGAAEEARQRLESLPAG
jgi:hypothetical protein